MTQEKASFVSSKIKEERGYGHQGLVVRLDIFDELQLANLRDRLKNVYDYFRDAHSSDLDYETIKKAINFLSKLTTVSPQESSLFDAPEEKVDE